MNIKLIAGAVASMAMLAACATPIVAESETAASLDAASADVSADVAAEEAAEEAEAAVEKAAE